MNLSPQGYRRLPSPRSRRRWLPLRRPLRARGGASRQHQRARDEQMRERSDSSFELQHLRLS